MTENSQVVDAVSQELIEQNREAYDELAKYDTEEEARFARMMKWLAEAEGEAIIAEAQRLRNDPEAQMPPDMDARCRELIAEAFRSA